MKKIISILGCGWVGKVLAEKLELEHTVHCLARDIEANQKAKLYACNVLVIAIPPRENYLEVLTQTIEKIDSSTQVIFLSSTSFYAGHLAKLGSGEFTPTIGETKVITSDEFCKISTGKELVVKGEALIKKLHKNVLILRLSGLMGYDRIAGKYTAGKRKAHDALVNYVHRDDVVNIIKLCIQKEVIAETFDVVAPLHPKQSEIYAQNARTFAWEDTYFESDEVLGHLVSSDVLVGYLGYKFLKSNPLEFW